MEGLCAVAKRRAGWKCPPSLRAPASSSDTITAALPHWRLNMIVRELRNVIVAGSGVGDNPYAKINIESATAAASITDDAGNQSDFIFSGDADSYCTASTDLSK